MKPPEQNLRQSLAVLGSDGYATAAYDLLKMATETFLLLQCGVSLEDELPPRVLVAGGTSSRRRAAAEQWRVLGARVATLSAKKADEAKRYARAWDYDLLMWQPGSEAKLTRMRDGRTRKLRGAPSDEALSWSRVGNES